MNLQLPESPRKGDIMAMLANAKREIAKARSSEFSDFVTAESWTASPTAVVAYRKDKIPMLEAAGVMKDPKDFKYGWFRSNESDAILNKELRAMESLLDEIRDFINGCTLRPKRGRYTELELSRFTVIEGGEQMSSLALRLKEGVAHG
ncbi:MAG: hypothetical protein FWB91_06590 [Defluviitaleaceae bacterium]|nr:hypothetical protein [Defluviitaleaceae bacterium]